MLNTRVYIDTPLHSGVGVITNVLLGEVYPIQVELDSANESGGKTYRVDSSEIRILDGIEANTEIRYNHPIPERQKTALEGSWDVVKYNDEYLVAKPSKGSISSCYEFNGYFRGKLNIGTFKLIGPYADYKDDVTNTINLEAETAVIEFNDSTPKKRSKKEKSSAGEQLSLF